MSTLRRAMVRGIRCTMRAAMLATILFLLLRPGCAEDALADAITANDWPRVEALCRDRIAVIPTDASARYNLACALARQAHGEAGLAALQDAVAAGFSDELLLAGDPDLVLVRALPGFAAVQQRVQTQALAAPFERGRPIAGTRSIEDLPPGGLRFRVRLPVTATPAHPSRLVLWLHPSGGSMNREIEDFAADLASRQLALVVFTRKQFAGWSDAESTALAGPTLAALAAIPGVDASHPVLFGFSAGGQLALELWRQDPSRFNALAISSAYPVELEPAHPPLVLPAGAPVAGSRILALVGGSDRGLSTWGRVAADWAARGIDLRTDVVPDHRHEFLFDQRRQALLAWFAALPRASAPPPAQ